MGFYFLYIYHMEIFKSVCSNPWCKSHFTYTENDMVVIKEDVRTSKINEILDDPVKVPPSVCKKCISFNNELSGGVTWVDKEYEGSRFDDQPHQIRYRVTNYKL